MTVVRQYHNNIMEKTLKTIKDYWVILAFIVSIVVTWTTFDTRLSALEENQSEIIIIQKERDVQYSQLQVDIAEIKTSIEFIREKLN